jgi:hypothetical protein
MTFRLQLRLQPAASARSEGSPPAYFICFRTTNGWAASCVGDNIQLQGIK